MTLSFGGQSLHTSWTSSWAHASREHAHVDLPLYRQSPAGSECEAFGNTCAYTTDGSQWCVDVYASASACGDPTLDALYDACAGGDWQACDDLFMQAPVGSECEDYGNTCAYTTDGTQWCVDVYGG